MRAPPALPRDLDTATYQWHSESIARSVRKLFDWRGFQPMGMIGDDDVDDDDSQ